MAVALAEAFPETLEVTLADALAVILAVEFALMLAVTFFWASLLKELVAIAGMRDTEKKSESVTLFQGFSPEQLDAIGGNNVKQIAKAERTEDK